jgi:hypothetical protein
LAGNAEIRKALPGFYAQRCKAVSDSAANLAPSSAARNNSRMNVPEDRRRKRSQDPLVALHYQLSHARHEGRLDAIVVADGSGVVVAGAGAWAVCEELAAYAPLLLQGVWNEPGLGSGRGSRVAELCKEVDVQPVDIEGQTVLLCARGGLRPAAMERAAQGVARILKTAA